MVAVIGINEATEVNDYVMPTGILRRADVADVLMVATGSGPVKLYPALTVEPDVTVAEFDSRHPDGADYVIVPQMSRADDPAALQWIKSSVRQGRHCNRRLRGSQDRRRGRTARQQARHDALVLLERAAREASVDAVRAEQAVSSPTRVS